MGWSDANADYVWLIAQLPPFRAEFPRLASLLDYRECRVGPAAGSRAGPSIFNQLVGLRCRWSHPTNHPVLQTGQQFPKFSLLDGAESAAAFFFNPELLLSGTRCHNPVPD